MLCYGMYLWNFDQFNSFVVFFKENEKKQKKSKKKKISKKIIEKKIDVLAYLRYMP